jgi:hypothetical protein
MAFNIKKDFPKTEFCAFVQMRPGLEFLKSQKDVSYSSLVLEEDIHKKLYEEKLDHSYLHWLEKEYGIPNLWPYLYYDRVIMSGQLLREYPYDKPLLSHENMMRRVQVTAKTIIEFLDKEKPDVFVISVIGSVTGSLLYNIAQKRGIKTINIDFARIHNRMAFSEDYRTFTDVKKLFKDIDGGRVSPETEEAERYLREFRERPAPFHESSLPTFNNQTLRRANIQFLKPQKLAWGIYWHIKTFFTDLGKKKNGDYTDVFVWWAIWDKAKRKIRGLIGYADLYSPIVPKERFAYYPMHLDPEIATMLYAPYYTNQAHLIKQIARSLPFDMKLYIKEHPAMVGYRTRNFYKEILKTPNVKLINPAINGYDLARLTDLTITITSTSAWETLLFKKPIISFGDVFYNDIPGVKRCRGFEELPYLVKEQLENWKHDESKLISYISALLEDSVPVDYVELWTKAESSEQIMEDEGLIKLTHSLSKKIGFKK